MYKLFLITLILITHNLFNAATQSDSAFKIANIDFVVYTNNLTYILTPETVHNLNPNTTTVFIIHGFLSGTSALFQDIYIQNITTAYRQVGYNTIMVDWTHYEYALNYVLLVDRGIENIGTAVGQQILLLQANAIDLKSVTALGMSFGAHIAGYAGRYVKQQTNSTIHRIVGLDPAGPLLGRIYGILENPNGLRSTDADIVDVSHTNGQLLGTTDTIGTIDYFVNGGLSQPRCVDGWEFLTPLGGIILNVCSHEFSSVLYRVTIGNSNYKASSHPDSCQDLVVYGAEFNGNATGVYYLRTELEYPYNSLC